MEIRDAIMITTILITFVLLLACKSDAISSDWSEDVSNARLLWRNKINTQHLVRLEFSGVTYASISLDVVKADLVDVIEDVLTEHFSDGIEVLDVERTDNYRRNLLRHRNSNAPPATFTRRLSFIVLAVQVSLRHDSWISRQTTLEETIDILSEYVDKDFRQYMKNLPGNGDYTGDVEVLEAYTDIAINVPGTQSIPITSPTSYQQPTTTTSQSVQDDKDNYLTTGIFPFELSFSEVSHEHANSQILRSYIQYGIERILRDNMDADVQLVSVSMQPWLPRLWLNFPMTITLQFPKSWDASSNRHGRWLMNAFNHAYTVLGNNIDDLGLYLDDYIRDKSPSYSERTQLESELKDVFGEVASIEIEKETTSPSKSPTKVNTPVVNDWINVKSDTDSFTMPWWGWVIVGGGIVMICMCCFLCVVYSMRGRHSDTYKKKETVVTNVIHVENDPDTKQATQHYRTSNEEKVAKEYHIIDQNKRSMTKNKLNPENEYNLAALQDPQYIAPVQQKQQLLLYNANPGNDLVVYEPNPNALDPGEDRIVVQTKSKKDKRQKSNELVVYEPNPNAPDPDEDRIAKPKKGKKTKKKGKKKKKQRDP